MREIIIDEEFKSLLPPLDKETSRLLEENILEHGCRDPLVLWNGILIDGYNRYRICREHNIPFNTVDKEFGSREEALIWIIGNQVSRRNLTPMQMSHFRGLHYKAEKKSQGENNRFLQSRTKDQNGLLLSGSTADRLAEQYRVSKGTIKRDVKLAEGISMIGKVSPEAKRKILSGEVAIDKAKLQALSFASKEDAEAIVAQIDEGTYKRRPPRPPAQAQASGAAAPDLSEIRNLGVIAREFADNFDALFSEHGDSAPAKLKPALRSYIDKLEGLYKSM